jgi:hypothetical protein
MKLKATITKKDRRFFPYQVRRLHGTGIPESSVSCHMTIKRAERAAKRYTKSHRPDEHIATFEGSDGKPDIPPPPPRTGRREPRG